jgi:hypothetical protein
MAYKSVQLIIGQLLTDEEFRAKFCKHPTATLSSLRESGVDLTSAEIDALLWTNRRLWKLGPEWIDPRLQRCSLSARGTASPTDDRGSRNRERRDRSFSK